MGSPPPPGMAPQASTFKTQLHPLPVLQLQNQSWIRLHFKHITRVGSPVGQWGGSSHMPDTRAARGKSKTNPFAQRCSAILEIKLLCFPYHCTYVHGSQLPCRSLGTPVIRYCHEKMPSSPTLSQAGLPVLEEATAVTGSRDFSVAETDLGMAFTRSLEVPHTCGREQT